MWEAAKWEAAKWKAAMWKVTDDDNGAVIMVRRKASASMKRYSCRQ